MSWSTEEKDSLVKALTVVCETTQTVWSQPTQDVVLKKLSAYTAAQVIAALALCLDQVKFKLSYADIASRIDDGRPGAEEAWSMMPKEEEHSGCVTREMSEAWGAASGLFENSDRVGARMAFKEKYQRAVSASRAAGVPTKWNLSPGWDRAGREAMALEGLKDGRLSESQAMHYALPEKIAEALGRALPPLPEHKDEINSLVSGLLGKKAPPHWTEKEEADT